MKNFSIWRNLLAISSAIVATSGAIPTFAGSNLVSISTSGVDRGVFAPPSDLGIVRDVTVAGCYQDCALQAIALRLDGTVRAWGPAGSQVPGDVQACRSIHSTPNAFYAVNVDGTVRTWPIGAHESILLAPAGMGAVTKVSGLWEVVIALRLDGTVWWSGTRNYNVYHPMPAGLSGCTDVATGSNDGVGLALLGSGEVVWWGSEFFDCEFPGIKCHERILPRADDLSPLPIVADSPIVSLATAYYGEGMLTARGKPMLFGREGYYWGSNGLFSQICGTFTSLDMTADQPFYGNVSGTRTTGDYQDWRMNSSCDTASVMPPGRAVAIRGSRHYMTKFIIYEPESDLDGDDIADEVDNCSHTYNPGQEATSDCGTSPPDCDSDGVPDAIAVSTRQVEDWNGNGKPDRCECVANANGDLFVNGADIGVLLAQWGSATPDSQVDFNRDGRVDGSDLGYLLSNWGPCTN
jgi:hypothetical protein